MARRRPDPLAAIRKWYRHTGKIERTILSILAVIFGAFVVYKYLAPMIFQ